MKLVVELGLKLDKDFDYYDVMLINHGLKRIKVSITSDIYYTNKDLNNLSENEMKNACVRFRTYNIIERDYKKENVFLSIIQNYSIFDSKVNKIECKKEEFKEYEEKLINSGYRKVFEVIKTDYQYKNESMESMVQLQYTDGLGLILYYDNPKYYNNGLDEQRKLLIDELNSYGFNFDYNVLGLDRLRTLYYKKEMFSKNQNQ